MLASKPSCKSGALLRRQKYQMLLDRSPENDQATKISLEVECQMKVYDKPMQGMQYDGPQNNLACRCRERNQKVLFSENLVN